MVEFKSRHSNLIIPLPNLSDENPYGKRVQFSNGVLKTEDPDVIKALRTIADAEMRGGNRMIEETAETDGLRLTGIIHLELYGMPNYKLVVEDLTIQEVANRIKQIAEIPLAQNAHRLDNQQTRVHPQYAPDFGMPSVI